MSDPGHWFEREPLWFKRAVFYEIHIRGFFDANGDGSGDFRGLTEKLDYLQWLGVDCIWLPPFFKSPLRDGGYDIADFFQIQPDYGTVDDVRDFIEAAHQRGIRVIADLVMNHTSSDHAWFQEARSSRDIVTARCSGAPGGAFQRTSVGRSCARPLCRASSSRWAARCHGSSSGVPTSNSPPGVRTRRSDFANDSVRSIHPDCSSAWRSRSTWLLSTGPCCRTSSGERVLRAGEGSLGHVRGERASCVGQGRAQVGVRLHEPQAAVMA